MSRFGTNTVRLGEAEVARLSDAHGFKPKERNSWRIPRLVNNVAAFGIGTNGSQACRQFVRGPFDAQ